MAILLRCPGCNKKLRVPDHAVERKVFCPGCSSTFVFSPELAISPLLALASKSKAPPAPPPEPEPEAEPIAELDLADIEEAMEPEATVEEEAVVEVEDMDEVEPIFEEAEPEEKPRARKSKESKPGFFGRLFGGGKKRK